MIKNYGIVINRLTAIVSGNMFLNFLCFFFLLHGYFESFHNIVGELFIIGG